MPFGEEVTIAEQALSETVLMAATFTSGKESWWSISS
jgi:hypothetical protein